VLLRGQHILGRGRRICIVVVPINIYRRIACAVLRSSPPSSRLKAIFPSSLCRRRCRHNNNKCHRNICHYKDASLLRYSYNQNKFDSNNVVVTNTSGIVILGIFTIYSFVCCINTEYLRIRSSTMN